MLAPRRLASPRGAGLEGWRRTVHGLAIVAGWLLFFWGWHRVLAATPDFSELRLLMLGAAVVVPVVTVSWILHNRGIHRRKGPRRSVPAATLAYAVDFNGREIVADFRSLGQAQRVWIVIDGTRKHYQQEAGAVASSADDPAEGRGRTLPAAPPQSPPAAPSALAIGAGGVSSSAAATSGVRTMTTADAGEASNDRGGQPQP